MSEASGNFDYVEQRIRQAAIDEPFVTLGQPPALPAAKVIGVDTLELVAGNVVWSEAEIAALRQLEPPLNEK